MRSPSGNVILCKLKDKSWHFLPGGHVENGESAKEALKRELREELGIKNIDISSFVGICENLFVHHKDKLQHEVNIIFEVNLPTDDIKSKEDHIEFIATKEKDLKKQIILPEGIQEEIADWVESEKPFFKEIK